MAITQDRLAELLSAAQDYQQALDQAVRCVQSALHAVQRGQDPHSELLRLHSLVFAAGLLKQPTISPTIIGVEAASIKANWYDNIRRRKSAAEYRSGERKPKHPRPFAPRDTASYSLIPPAAHESQQSFSGERLASGAPTSPRGYNLTPEEQAAIIRQAEADVEAEERAQANRPRGDALLRVDGILPTMPQPPVRQSQSIANGGKRPVMTGPRDAPGLYDDDDDPWATVTPDTEPTGQDSKESEGTIIFPTAESGGE